MSQLEQHPIPQPVLADGLSVFPSLMWEREIRDLRDVNPSLKFLALILKTYADSDGGSIRPTLDELHAQLGLSHAQIKRLRKELCDLGYLNLIQKGNGNGRASTYRLTFPEGKVRLMEDSKVRLITSPKDSPKSGSLDEPLSETEERKAPKGLLLREEREPLSSSSLGDSLSSVSEPKSSEANFDPDSLYVNRRVNEPIASRLSRIADDIGPGLPWTQPEAEWSDTDEPITRERIHNHGAVALESVA